MFFYMEVNADTTVLLEKNAFVKKITKNLFNHLHIKEYIFKNIQLTVRHKKLKHFHRWSSTKNKA